MDPNNRFGAMVKSKATSQKTPGECGFTLIELLVVIAIIAILAAILFPVFARAKLAAKKTASLSNIKQIALSIVIYGNDYDDNFVIAGQWHSSDPDAYKAFPQSPYMPWTGLVEPYLENREVMRSPAVGSTKSFVGPGFNQCSRLRECDLLYPTYGFNAMYLNRTIYPAFGPMSSISVTSVVRPSEEVMLAEIWSRNNTTFGSLQSGADIAYISLATVEPPDGATPPNSTSGNLFGRMSWGNYNGLFNSELVNKEEGLYRAGTAFRYANFTTTAFVDGHVKVMNAQGLAAGTNWVDETTSKAKNLHDGKYLWDPRE